MASRKALIALTEEMRTAMNAWCDAYDTTLSDLLRNAALEKIGRDDLAGTMPGRGQPKQKPVAGKATGALHRSRMPHMP